MHAHVHTHTCTDAHTPPRTHIPHPPHPHAQIEYNIRVQLLEIYNESLRDLLVSEADARAQRPLQLVTTQRSGNNVPDAIQASAWGGVCVRMCCVCVW